MPLKLGTISKTIPYSKAYLGDILKFQKVSAIEFTSCIFPTSWTAVSGYTDYEASNEYGEWTINAYGVYASRPIKNAFDGDASTMWSGSKLSSGGSGAITITYSGAILPKEIYLKRQSMGASTIQGFNVKTNQWETIYNLAAQDRTAVEQTLQIETGIL